MHLRYTRRRKDGRVQRYWRLVRSVRVGRKLVQQTVAHLGELDACRPAPAKALACAIPGDREQSDLFSPDEAEVAIPVRLKMPAAGAGPDLRRRVAGPDAVAVPQARRSPRPPAARRRGTDAVGDDGHRAGPGAALRAVDELHIAATWFRGTALENFFALPAPLVNDDRLYRALDRLLAHQDALKQHLAARLGELFALDYDLLLYDVTSVYFEGGRGESAGPARAQPRSPTRLPPGLSGPGRQPREGCRLATRSSPATGSTSPR
jgi:hypothetical protein